MIKDENERFKKQMDFILEIDKLKDIGRQTYLSNGERKENDAEHSWHLAIMAYLLAEHANDEVDVAKVMLMVLLHDIVEIDAGDTYAYDVEAHKTKAEREKKAADRIFNILPADQAVYFRSLWEEFEENTTACARFANSLDKIQPLMLNDATGGKAWREHNATSDKVETRFKSTSLGSEKIWEYGQSLIDKNRKEGKLFE